MPAETVERLLADSDGLTTAALAKQANGDPADALGRLRELEATGLFVEQDSVEARAGM